MYVFIYTYAYIYACIYLSTYIRLCTYTYIYMHMYGIYIHAFKSIYICVHLIYNWEAGVPASS